MLQELQVENLGVIESITLLLGPGMTVLTGETGAGKTLVVEAIELLMGGRADPVLVRPGTSEARVEGRFIQGDDEIVLARVVPSDGRSRAYVNGRLATAATLTEHGNTLLDLHGQHSHQSLLAPGAQRSALDQFAVIDLSPLRAARSALSEIDAALAALGGDDRARARELDLLRYQLDELDRAALVDVDEERQLDLLEDTLADAQAHREHGHEALARLTDDGAGLDALRGAIGALQSRAPYHELVGRLRSIASELDDVVGDVRTAVERIEEDPERLDQVRSRRQLLVGLRRKYGDDLTAVMVEHHRIAVRAEELASRDARAAEFDRARIGALDTERKAAAVVARARRKAAAPLGTTVQDHLRALALPKARIVVEVDGDDPADTVRFLLGANPGEPLLPLAKVASGGELARTMLALRLVLSAGPETLVFDEVDAGIGGEAAVAVGSALAKLGTDHQVLVVTHLAQVAAFAHHHVNVVKHERAGRTVSAVQLIDGENRVEELSRMLAGRVTAAARAHAKELLINAGSHEDERPEPPPLGGRRLGAE